jgi:hypothetical protein
MSRIIDELGDKMYVKIPFESLETISQIPIGKTIEVGLNQFGYLPFKNREYLVTKGILTCIGVYFISYEPLTIVLAHLFKGKRGYSLEKRFEEMYTQMEEKRLPKTYEEAYLIVTRETNEEEVKAILSKLREEQEIKKIWLIIGNEPASVVVDKNGKITRIDSSTKYEGNLFDWAKLLLTELEEDALLLGDEVTCANLPFYINFWNIFVNRRIKRVKCI